MIRGQGMPSFRTSGAKGNLYIQFDVKFPSQPALLDNIPTQHLMRALHQSNGLVRPKKIPGPLDFETKTERMLRIEREYKEIKPELDAYNRAEKERKTAGGMDLDPPLFNKKGPKSPRGLKEKKVEEDDYEVMLDDLPVSQLGPPSWVLELDQFEDERETEEAREMRREKRDIHITEETPEDVDSSGQRRAHGATMEDEEEDGVPAGGERMQCASQ